MNKGESSIKSQNKESSERNDKKQQKKPSELDEERRTGETDKNINKGLLTHKKSDKKEGDKKEPEEKENENAEEDKDASMWRSMKQATEHEDGQMVDGGTREQALEAPAPVQDDEAEEPEEEGVAQDIMEVSIGI